MEVCCSISILEVNFRGRHFLLFIYICTEELKIQVSPRTIFMPHFTVANYGSEFRFLESRNCEMYQV